MGALEESMIQVAAATQMPAMANAAREELEA